ncbi:MAG: hypothetical protein IMY72_06125 [Bacteroidetes bacterium]|nr:hypothetical protein [Bacteroidota bacterium]
MEIKNKSIENLMQLGFNNLEAEIYFHLLSNLPMTAYKIGRQLNKPTANVYKAIDSLSKKGAVMFEDNNKKHCKAISPDEFFSQYEKNIIDKTNSTKKLLNNIDKESFDERSYTIESVPLVFERFNTMMKKCKVVAVIDAFPKTLELVLDSINEAISRGVEVFIEVYEPIEIKGANVSYANFGGKVIDYWKSQQLNLIIDGEEHLISLMNNDLSQINQATWSNNTYMSCMLYAGFMREQTMMKIMSKVDKPNFEKEVKKLLENQRFFFNSKVPGFDKLFNVRL